MTETALRPDMRLSFSNEGGIANGGVCWWHSRFQRSAWALAEFAPDQPRPTRVQAAALIDALAKMSHVVVIPGYPDLLTFTHDHADLVQRELNQWQLRDGFVNLAWTRGLARRSSYGPSKAMKMMDRLHSKFRSLSRRNHVTWVKLQMPGVTAHAALILDMTRDTDGNYELKVVDSNFQDRTETWSFRRGDTHLQTPFYGKTMPFDGYERDLSRIDAARETYCRRHGDAP